MKTKYTYSVMFAAALAGAILALFLAVSLCGCERPGSSGYAYRLSQSDEEESTASGEADETEKGEVTTQEQSGEERDPGTAEKVTAEEKREEIAAVESEALVICVYVCGAVVHPGVVTLPSGSRVYQAIEAVGGLTDDAEEKCLNQAAVLTDGEQITVWTVEEADAADRGQAAGAQGQDPGQVSSESREMNDSDGKINLNTAGVEELCTLSGIGQTRASSIIAYREANGYFTSIEEIMNITGIKERIFEQIKDYITV